MEEVEGLGAKARSGVAGSRARTEPTKWQPAHRLSGGSTGFPQGVIVQREGVPGGGRPAAEFPHGSHAIFNKGISNFIVTRRHSHALSRPVLHRNIRAINSQSARGMAHARYAPVRRTDSETVDWGVRSLPRPPAAARSREPT